MVGSIVIDGVARYCGLLETPTDVKKLFAPASEKIKLIPESDWKEISGIHFIAKILDQDGQNSCTAFSAVQSLMICRARQGLPYVELSAGSVYGPINGGRDAGSNIGEALRQLQNVGACTTATLGHFDWRGARSSSAWKEEAKSYRVDEAVLCGSIEEYVSGLQLGWCGNFGVAANSRFSPDSEGWMKGSGSGVNHSVLACGMKKNSKGQWFVELVNSWGNWGLGGYAYYPVDGLADYECWLIRNTIVE